MVWCSQSQAIFFYEALEVMQAINGSCDWSINSILQDIKGLAKYFEFIPRLLNEIAHDFARKTYIDSPNSVVKIP